MRQINNHTLFPRKVRRTLSTSTPFESNNSMGPQWQWKDNDGWRNYDAQTNGMIEQTFSLKRPFVLLDHGYFKEAGGYILDFQTMVQKRQTTGTERNIRRLDPSVSNGLAFVWEYEVSPNEWKSYDLPTSKLLEASLNNRHKIVFLNHGEFKKSKGGYAISFENLLQIRKETGDQIKIRRNPPPSSSTIYGIPQITTMVTSNSNSEENEPTSSKISEGINFSFL